MTLIDLTVPSLRQRSLDTLPVAIIGAGPIGLAAAANLVERGIDFVIYESGDDVTREIYTIKALVRSGNSGGPLVTPNGKVLGVIFAAAADDRNVGFAVTAKEAAGVARLGIERTREVRTGGCA